MSMKASYEDYLVKEVMTPFYQKRLQKLTVNYGLFSFAQFTRLRKRNDPNTFFTQLLSRAYKLKITEDDLLWVRF